MTALLVREAAAAKDGIESRDGVRPMLLDSQHRGQHQIGPAEPEIDEVVQPKRQDIERVIAQNLLPDCRGLVRVSTNPGGQGQMMGLLSRGGTLNERIGGGGRGFERSATTGACRKASPDSL